VPTRGSDWGKKQLGKDQAGYRAVEEEIVPFNGGTNRAGNNGAAQLDAVLIFGQVRSDDVEAFGIYAAGFVVRPIGAAIFGHYGDRIGRKATVIATLMLMGIAPFLEALVPTYGGEWGGRLQFGLTPLLATSFEGFAVPYFARSSAGLS